VGADRERQQQGTAHGQAARAQETAVSSDQPLFVDDVLRLQETAGNRAVTDLLGGRAPRSSGGVAGALFAGSYRFGRHPQFPSEMGQTFYNHNDLSWPSFKLNVENHIFGPYTAQPEPSHASKPAWDVLATPASADGYEMAGAVDDKHPGKVVRIRVSDAAAAKILAAEKQHVADLDRGYGISAGMIDNAINVASAEDPVEGDTAAAAKANAIDKIVSRVGDLGPKIRPALEQGGRLEDAVGPMMDNAYLVSQAQRDTSKKHMIPVSKDPVEVTDTAVIYAVDDTSALDATSARDIISIATIGGSS
jgi:hypothetical protein